MTPATEERETTVEEPFIRFAGRFLADREGYSIVNEDGLVLAYFARKVGSWNADADRYHGFHVEFVLSPEGQMTVVEISP
jgi:hypothetical protein